MECQSKAASAAVAHDDDEDETFKPGLIPNDERDCTRRID